MIRNCCVCVTNPACRDFFSSFFLLAWCSDLKVILSFERDARPLFSVVFRSMTQESKELASQTNQTLAEQSAQLDRIDRDLNDVNRSLSFAERSIRSIQSWGGTVANWFGSGPAQEDHRYHQQAPDIDRERAANEARLEQQRSERQRRMIQQQQQQDRQSRHNGHQIQTADGLSERARRRQQVLEEARAEEDECLDALNDMLSGLKQDALVMNRQLRHQQGVLAHIDHEMSRTNERMERNTHNVQRLR